MNIQHIELRGPGAPPPGHAPITNFWHVAVILDTRRMMEWEVVLPLVEVLDALKTVTVTESSIEIAHPAFEEQTNAAKGTQQRAT